MSGETPKFRNPVPETLRKQFSTAGLTTALWAGFLFHDDPQGKQEAREQPLHLIRLTLPEYENPQDFLDALNDAKAARAQYPSLDGFMTIAARFLETGRQQAEQLVAARKGATGAEETVRKIVEGGAMGSGQREIKPGHGLE